MVAVGEGARRNAIRNQFLVEAMMMTLAGGVVSIAVGGGSYGPDPVVRFHFRRCSPESHKTVNRP